MSMYPYPYPIPYPIPRSAGGSNLTSRADPQPFADSVFGTLVSGLGGAIVGGLIAAIAVAFTLRHNRQMAIDERTLDMASAIVGLVAQAVRMLDGDLRLPTEETLAFRWRMIEIQEHLIRMETLTQRDSGRFSQVLHLIAAQIHLVADSPQRVDRSQRNMYVALMVLRRTMVGWGPGSQWTGFMLPSATEVIEQEVADVLAYDMP